MSQLISHLFAKSLAVTSSGSLKQWSVSKCLEGFKSWLVLCLGAVMLIPAAPALAIEMLSATPGTTNATVNISIVIPSILQILENTHPQALSFAAAKASRTSAVQRVVLLSTLRGGFCMDLRVEQAQVSQWQMKLSGNPNVRMEEVAGGYRLCTRRPGRYELALEHEFLRRDSATLLAQADTSAMGWPVNVSLATP